MLSSPLPERAPDSGLESGPSSLPGGALPNPVARRDGRPTKALVIERGPAWSVPRLGEVWAYRELLAFLVLRDIKLRYKQTVLGAAWAVLQPLAIALVLTLVFGRLGGIPSEGSPYLLFAFVGLLPWTFFAQALTQATNSIVASANLITKVYFPRLLIPASAVLGALLDFVVASTVLVLLMAHYRRLPPVQALALPPLVLLAIASAMGVGVWLAALNVEYRDVRHVVPFVVQLWFLLTPVVYPASSLALWAEERGLPRWLLGLNPMSGVVDGFRWALLGGRPLDASILSASIASATVLVVSGAVYFRRVERSFADVV